MKKKKKKKAPYEDLDFDEPSSGPSFMKRLKDSTKKQTRKAPVTFNVGLAVILFFCYLSISFVSLPTYPQLLIVLLPTLYIIIRYIQLEREKYESER